MGVLAALFVAQSVDLLCRRLRTSHTRSQRELRLLPRGRDCDAVFRYLAYSCASMLSAFSPLVWQYSVTAEVFALNNFLLSWLCCLAICFADGHDFDYAAWGALVSGLALCNQHTAVLYVAPLATWVWVQLITSRCRLLAHPWRRLAKDAMILTVMFILGLMPYIYLPLAARWAPRPGSWGNVTTMRGMWHHLRRGDYGSLRLYAGSVNSRGHGFFERLRQWGMDVSLVQGIAGVVPAFAMLGVMATLLRPSYALPRQHDAGDTKPTIEALRRSCPSGAHRQGSDTAGEIKKSTTCASSDGNGPKRKDSNKSKGDELEGTHAARGDSAGSLERKRRLSSGNSERTPAGRVSSFLGSLDDEGSSIFTVLLVSLISYLVVFHWLSNMPLDDPLLFGVHARFWMQPNILVFVFCGLGIHRTCDIIRYNNSVRSNCHETKCRLSVYKIEVIIG